MTASRESSLNVEDNGSCATGNSTSSTEILGNTSKKSVDHDNLPQQSSQAVSPPRFASRIQVSTDKNVPSSSSGCRQFFFSHESYHRNSKVRSHTTDIPVVFKDSNFAAKEVLSATSRVEPDVERVLINDSNLDLISETISKEDVPQSNRKRISDLSGVGQEYQEISRPPVQDIQSDSRNETGPIRSTSDVGVQVSQPNITDNIYDFIFEVLNLKKEISPSINNLRIADSNGVIQRSLNISNSNSGTDDQEDSGLMPLTANSTIKPILEEKFNNKKYHNRKENVMELQESDLGGSTCTRCTEKVHRPIGAVQDDNDPVWLPSEEAVKDIHKPASKPGSNQIIFNYKKADNESKDTMIKMQTLDLGNDYGKYEDKDISKEQICRTPNECIALGRQQNIVKGFSSLVIPVIFDKKTEKQPESHELFELSDAEKEANSSEKNSENKILYVDNDTRLKNACFFNKIPLKINENNTFVGLAENKEFSYISKETLKMLVTARKADSREFKELRSVTLVCTNKSTIENDTSAIQSPRTKCLDVSINKFESSKYFSGISEFNNSDIPDVKTQKFCKEPNGSHASTTAKLYKSIVTTRTEDSNPSVIAQDTKEQHSDHLRFPDYNRQDNTEKRITFADEGSLKKVIEYRKDQDEQSRMLVTSKPSTSGYQEPSSELMEIAIEKQVSTRSILKGSKENFYGSRRSGKKRTSRVSFSLFPEYIEIPGTSAKANFVEEAHSYNRRSGKKGSYQDLTEPVRERGENNADTSGVVEASQFPVRPNSVRLTFRERLTALKTSERNWMLDSTASPPPQFMRPLCACCLAPKLATYSTVVWLLLISIFLLPYIIVDTLVNRALTDGFENLLFFGLIFTGMFMFTTVKLIICLVQHDRNPVRCVFWFKVSILYPFYVLFTLSYIYLTYRDRYEQVKSWIYVAILVVFIIVYPFNIVTIYSYYKWSLVYGF